MGGRWVGCVGRRTWEGGEGGEGNARDGTEGFIGYRPAAAWVRVRAAFHFGDGYELYARRDHPKYLSI